jgi:hypothetical protein
MNFSKLRSRWLIILFLIVLLQTIGLFLGPRDLGLLAVGESPRFSTTFGIIILDGGSAVYHGIGYTLSYRLEPFRYRSQTRSVAYAQVWYWIPFLNFLPNDCFVDLVEMRKLREARNKNPN